MILTQSSSPGVTTCSGASTCSSAISEMWTRPSMPSPTWTNAPMEETDLPFAAYSAALDREQSAATVYGRAVERLERSL